MRGDATDHPRRVLPRQHQDAHQWLTVVAGGVTYASVVLLGEHDLHFFGEGTHRRLWQWLGAHPLADGGVQFAVWAPNAKSVRVVGDWDGWVDGDVLEPQGKSGVWAGIAKSADVGYRYKFAVEAANGNVMMKADPMAYATECPPATASVVAAPSTHTWGDDSWMSTRGHGPGHPLRIYEMHLASWRHGVYSYRELAHQVADHVARSASPTSSCCRSPSTRSAARGAIRSPATTRRPRGSALPTTSGRSSTSSISAASA